MALNNSLLDPQRGRNWIHLITRLVLAAALGGATVLLDPQPIAWASLNLPTYLTMPIMVGTAGALLVGAIAIMPPLRVYAPVAIIIADCLYFAAFVYYGSEGDILITTLGLLLLISTGVLRLGYAIGLVHSIFLFTTTGGALYALSQNGLLAYDLADSLPLLVVTGGSGVLLLALNSIWYNVIDEENHSNRRKVRREITEARQQVAYADLRLHSFAEISAALNATLNYDKILDAAMNIGALSLQSKEGERLISLALMVINSEELAITNARGISHLDEQTTFRGERGILSEVLTKNEPVAIDLGEDDPELRRVRAFQGIHSTICVPLRAKYETYGVLVFGTTTENAINYAHFDAISALGTQVTLALQNAVLYATLQEEKDRIIRIEENGRKSLVRDLHDIPTQTIAAVAMQLSVIPMMLERQPEQVVEEIESIREMAIRAGEEIRHVMFTLRPLSLETQGLSAALDQLSEKMHDTYKQAMIAEIDPAIERLLDRDEQGTLFYLIEEAANNARKYAEASLIRVSGTLTREEIVIKVRDNGKGFDMGRVSDNYELRGSFGMVNMRERAELINGTLEIESRLGTGTIVRVRIPRDDDLSNYEVPLIIPHKPKKKRYTGPLSPAT